MVKKTKQSKPDDKASMESVNRRLDALIRILLEIHFDKKNKFNLTAAVKALNSCGLGPTAIGNIFGKKKTDINPLLYKKNKKKSKKTTEVEMAEREANDSG